jgi:hypothetical protein
MLRWYPEELWHRLGFARGIDRDAIMARARPLCPLPISVPSTPRGERGEAAARPSQVIQDGPRSSRVLLSVEA